MALALVTGAAALLRFFRLGTPFSLVFDERYYIEEACSYATWLALTCAERIHTIAHPPLAKWLIVSGMTVFGHNPIGWRVTAAAAGTVTVALVYLVGRRLLRSTWSATLAAGLLAIDLLHLIHSRLAMLDVFLTMFATAAVVCCVFDLSGATAAAGRSAALRENRSWMRPWRILAGVALGAAVASKAPGVLTLVTVVVITLAAAWDRSRKAGWSQTLVQVLREQGMSVAVWLVALPLAVYALAHVGTISGSWIAWPWDKGAWLNEFWTNQRASVRVHAALDQSHIFRSEPWFWFSSRPPLIYYFGSVGDSAYQMIIGVGNPIAWWFAIPALFYTAARATRVPQIASPEGIIVLGFVFAYAPWLAVGGTRTTFLYYILPALPLMCLALALTASVLARSRVGRVLAAIWMLALGGTTVFAYPLVSAGRVDLGSWRTVMGIARPDDRPNCDAPIHEKAGPTDRPSNC
jgi:dolichyl-phosphate-mannose--protein O-mannosyl transferase